jgi:hypothetical protein
MNAPSKLPDQDPIANASWIEGGRDATAHAERGEALAELPGSAFSHIEAPR